MPIDSKDLTSDAASVERTIASIEQSGHLGRGDRRLGLLRYVVGEELAGRGEKINAYTIAMDVFGRTGEFDPKTDSIVRTEMGRLRNGLRLFNAESTVSDLVDIRIPKGSYRPEFRPRDEVASGGAGEGWQLPPRRFLLASLGLSVAILSYLAFAFWPNGPNSSETSAEAPFSIVRVAVMPFVASGDNPNVERLAFGLYSELSVDLSVYPWLAVVAPLEADGAENEAGADYVLRGEVLWEGDKLLSNIQLLALPGQELIWSNSLQADARTNSIEDAQEQIAYRVVERLASFHGIAPELTKQRNARKSQASLDAFLCFLGIYEYVQNPSDELHLASRECLQDVISRSPEYGEAHAALALLYMDEARQDRLIEPGSDPWKRAGEAIDLALTYAPLRQVTLNVALVHSIERPDRDIKAFSAHSSRLLELFPRHPGTLANVALRSGAYVGKWEMALPLARHAIDLQSRDPSWYFVLHSLHAILTDDLLNAEWALAKLTTNHSVIELIIRYIAASSAGQPAAATAVRDELSMIEHSADADIEQFVLDRRFDPDLEAALLSALSKAFAAEKLD